MNRELESIIRQGGGFTSCRELAEREFLSQEKDLARMDPDLRLILLIWWIEMEFSGGGVELYLRGICADHHNEILRMLEMIEANDVWSIFYSAKDFFEGGEVPQNQIERIARIDELYDDATIDQWDSMRESIDRRYNQSEGEPIGLRLLSYLAQKC